MSKAITLILFVLALQTMAIAQEVTSTSEGKAPAPSNTAGAKAIAVETDAVSTPAHTVPEGTILQIRLRQTISSFGTLRNTPVMAIVIAPVESNGRVILPMNTQINGMVTKVRRVGLGLGRETAYIDMDFDSITLPGGKPQTLKSQIVAVDDSRETIDADGRIQGIRATASFSSVLSGFAVSAGSIDPMLLGFALSSSLSVFRIPESEIILPVGAELRIKLDEALPVAGDYPAIAPKLIDSDAERDALTELIKTLPYRTSTDPGDVPSDITSLIYIGSEDAVTRALDAAGWVRSDKLDAKSTYGAMRAVVENQGYSEAPVSTLLLDGKKPIYAYAKTLDTFFKRHHSRVYATDKTFDGARLWSATGTHDSGIGFSRKAKTLIHIIDEDIDQERSKIINDMILTGCVEALSFIDRPWLPTDAKNATGDSLITDRRAAVLKLNKCENPNRADVAPAGVADPKTTESAFVRPFRDTMLTLRNDFYRGNIVYQGYHGVKMLKPIFRKSAKDSDPGKPRVIHLGGEQFEVVDGASALRSKDAPKEPGTGRTAFHQMGEKPSYKTVLDFAINAGWGRYGNSEFSNQPLQFSSPLTPVPFRLDTVTDISGGWHLGGRITLNSWRHFSNEFGYSFGRSTVRFDFRSLDAPDLSSSTDFRAQTRQFTYNLLVHVRPNGSRIRPYVAAGPLLQLFRTVESKPANNRVLKFAVKDLGLIIGAYEFGKKPPLEGGGIFQLGVQYGGGVKFQITPRFFTRIDFRESLTPQLDFWSKSYATLTNLLTNDTQTLTIFPLEKAGPMRRQSFTIGFGLSF